MSVGGKCILRGNVPETSIVHSPNCEIHFEIILIRVANYADVASVQQLDVHHWVLQRFCCSQLENGPVLNFNSFLPCPYVALQRVGKMRKELKIPFQIFLDTVKIIILCNLKHAFFSLMSYNMKAKKSYALIFRIFRQLFIKNLSFFETKSSC